MAQLKPFLQFSDALTQIWINKYSVAALLITIKLFSFISSLNHELDSVVQNYTGNKTCQYIDYIIYEAPKQLSLAANYMIRKSLQESLKASFYFFADFLLVVFNILFFLLDIWLGTYACLFLTAVDTTVDVAVNATEAVIGAANVTVHAAFKDLNKGLNDVSLGVDKVLDIYEEVENKIKNIFSSNELSTANSNVYSKIHSVNLTIASLNNFYIDGTINNKLNKLAADVPTFEELKNSSKNWLETPFYKVSNELKSQNFTRLTTPTNSSISLKSFELNLQGNFNSSEYINTNSWCINTVVPDVKESLKILLKVLKKAKMIIVILGILAFIFASVPELYKELLFWRKMGKMRNLVNSRLESTTLPTPLDCKIKQDSCSISEDSKSSLDTFANSVDTLTEHKCVTSCNNSLEVTDIYLATFQSWIVTLVCKIKFLRKYFEFGDISAKEKNLSPSRYKYNWLIKYIFSRRSSMLFLISVAGATVCLIEYVIVKKLESLFHGNNTDKFLSFKNNPKMKKKLQILFEGIHGSFATWQTNTNSYIAAVEQQGNNEVVVQKVEFIAGEVNKTATKIYDAISDTINATFFGTVFEKPLTGIMNCIIGNKLESIAKGSAWVKKEFQITLPRISEQDAAEIFNSLNSGTQSNSSVATDILSNVSVSTNMLSNVNNTSVGLALKPLENIISEVENIKSRIETDVNYLIVYYKKSIKYELSIVIVIFALWCLQWVVGLLLLKFRYRAI